MITGSAQVTSAYDLDGNAFTICVDGQGDMVGGVVSVNTVNENEHDAWFPEVSMADASTVYVPALNSPGERDTEVETRSTLS